MMKQKKIFQINIQTIFFIVVAGFILFSLFINGKDFVDRTIPEKPISTVLKEVKNNKVQNLEILEDKIIVHYKNDTFSRTTKEPGASLFTLMKESGINPLSVQIQNKSASQFSNVVNILINVVPTVLMIGFFIFLFRQARGAQDSIFSFGQSRAKNSTRICQKLRLKTLLVLKKQKKNFKKSLIS